MTNSDEHSPTPDTALAQVLVAFGSALGTLYVSHAAADDGLKRFRKVIADNLEQWNAQTPAVMDYARRIGRTTAWVTVSRGGGTVSRRDLLEALAKIESLKETDFLGGCPFFHDHR